MENRRKLLEEARRGDAEAFWRLAAPHRGLVYTAAYGLLKNRERAEDELHGALIHAFSRIGDLRDVDRLPGWLYTLTRNRVLDNLRREQRLQRALRGAAHGPRVVTLEEKRDREAWLVRMETALAALPEPFREILTLKYLNQSSLKEIAEVLELSLPAVKSRLFQARKLLKAKTEELVRRAGAAGEESPEC